MLAQKLLLPVRDIIYRTNGRNGGPITRLMSPSDLGEILKPFVFLDRFDFDADAAPMSMEHGWHPHSGIATVTVVLEGALRYADTTGETGLLPPGSVEWMQAGNGVWHTGAPEPGGVRGFQLWVALPPERENAPSVSNYVMPSDVPVDGPARVVLGAHGGHTSLIDAPAMNYLAVRLKDGERWSYQPPKGHTVAWAAVQGGTIQSAEPIRSGELAVFAPSEEEIGFAAEGDTMFVLGSAAPHQHALALGDYSVHTSPDALDRGEAEIRRIGAMLRAQGKSSAALRAY